MITDQLKCAYRAKRRVVMTSAESWRNRHPRDYYMGGLSLGWPDATGRHALKALAEAREDASRYEALR